MTEPIYDITDNIRSFLVGRTDVTDEVSERIFSPWFFHSDGTSNIDNEPNPKVAFRQDGGYPDYRYLFVVEADTLIDARRVATIVHNALVRGALEIQEGSPVARTIIFAATPVGGLNDSENSNTKYPQVFFSLVFQSI